MVFPMFHAFTLDFSAQGDEEERVVKAKERHPTGGGGLGEEERDDVR